MEYRKAIQLSSETEYWFVEMGPVPDRPAWHQEVYRHNRYPFPTEFAAFRFAASHKRRDPNRDIAVRCPDGKTVPITLLELGDIDGLQEPLSGEV